MPVLNKGKKRMETVRFVLGYDPVRQEVIEKSLHDRVSRRLFASLTMTDDLIDLGYGGMIVLSTDVNAEEGRGALAKIKSIGKSMLQRFFRQRTTDETIKKLVDEYGIDTGWSVGNLFKGRYRSPKTGENFNEKSYAIDIRGADMDFVKKVGKVLAKKFEQESVLLVDHETGRSFLLMA